LATYFSEKFGSQIQRQVNSRIIGTPATLSNLPIEALRQKKISRLTSTFEQEVYIGICDTLIRIIETSNFLKTRKFKFEFL
jgi:hypothetical protein